MYFEYIVFGSKYGFCIKDNKFVCIFIIFFSSVNDKFIIDRVLKMNKVFEF